MGDWEAGLGGRWGGGKERWWGGGHRARGRGGRKDDASMPDVDELDRLAKRAHPDLNQGPADLQSAALTTELCTHVGWNTRKTQINKFDHAAETCADQRVRVVQPLIIIVAAHALHRPCVHVSATLLPNAASGDRNHGLRIIGPTRCQLRDTLPRVLCNSVHANTDAHIV